jgi:enhancing lycopene biosynthesis protein 2
MAAKVGVVLSGCGYLDGAEVHESVLTLYFLEQKKPIVAICISPAVLAVALQRSGKSATLTIGNDRATADAVRSTGCTQADELVVGVAPSFHPAP